MVSVMQAFEMEQKTRATSDLMMLERLSEIDLRDATDCLAQFDASPPQTMFQRELKLECETSRERKMAEIEFYRTEREKAQK